MVRPLVTLLVFVPCAALAQVSAPAQPMQLGQPSTPTAEECKIIDLAGEVMDCDSGTCTIQGNAQLRCSGTRLSADRIDVDYDAEQHFTGARASGNVLYIRGRHVMTCTKLTVGPDHIQGTVDDALFRVKLMPPDLSQPGLPAGRNVATFSGDITRTSEQDYTVYGGEFTLCDCGLDPPSWRFTASEIDAHLGDRATLWSPVFHFRPFSLFEMPVPMAPISMPLSRRAFGVMPPNPRFLGGRPLLDLPIFIPIGDSYDLTVIPGTRGDWAAPTTFSPSTWGAPRLGGRLRYAPTETWFGELDVDYTHDGDHWRSRNAAKKFGAPSFDATASALLSERVTLNGFQRAQVARNLDWSATLSWVSDDAMLRDFATSLRDAASNYLPSRTGLLYRPDGFSATAIADYFVLTNNSVASDYSNTRGLERNTMHRMPFVRLAMEPLPLAFGLTLDADASFVRYGRLGSANPAHVANAPVEGLNVGNLVGGVGYANRLGHVNVQTRAATDALFTSGADGDHSINSLLLSARADTRVSRSFGSILHTVTPRLEYRSIPTQSGSLPLLLSIPSGKSYVIYDPRLQRRTFQQGMVAIDQALWTRGPLSALPILSLSLRQPFDLQSGRVLQSQAELQWRAPAWLTGTARLALAPGQREVLREVSATTSLYLRYLTLGLGYAHWQVNADRFVRSVYELAAPYESGSTTSALRPIHTLSGNIGTNIKQRLFLSYNTDYLMPLRNDQLPDPVNLDSPINRRTFTEHRGSIIYRSPCNCWGVTASMAFPNNDFWWQNKRINLLFDIGGYTLGN